MADHFRNASKINSKCSFLLRCALFLTLHCSATIFFLRVAKYIFCSVIVDAVILTSFFSALLVAKRKTDLHILEEESNSEQKPKD